MKFHTSLRHFGCLNKHHSSKLMHAETHARVSRATRHFAEPRGSAKYFAIKRWCLRTGNILCSVVRSHSLAITQKVETFFLSYCTSIRGSERNENRNGINALSSSPRDLKSNTSNNETDETHYSY